MDEKITIIDTVSPNDPVMIAAWPGMGLVGLKTVQFLYESFPVRKIAGIEPADFFRINGVVVKNGLINPPQIPKSEFFLFDHASGTNDIILFIGDEQPIPGKGAAFANLVADVADYFGVSKIITAAAMVTSVHHSEDSRVWAAATDPLIFDFLPGGTYITLTDGHIGGLNGLLLGIAAARGIPGCCLLGEIPYYVTNLENPKASMAILRLLSSAFRLDLDLAPLEQKAIFVEKQIENAVQQVRQDVRSSISSGASSDSESVLDNDDDSEEDHGIIN